MNMIKRRVTLFAAAVLAVCLAASACVAEILPPYGQGQIGYLAVVLCESLTVRQERSASSRSVTTLGYGDRFVVQRQVGGWADCFLSDAVDAGQSGWVNADYIIIDPAWYRTDESTPVYAWNDTTAPRVALLTRGTELPILRDEGDWLIVSLRGATGWIRKNAADRRASGPEAAFREITGLDRAEMTLPSGTYTLTDPEGLRWIEENFSGAREVGNVGCPFEGTLTLYFANGDVTEVTVATDSCHNFRTQDGRSFAYGNEGEAVRLYGDTNAIGVTFWGLFGLSAPEDIL